MSTGLVTNEQSDQQAQSEENSTQVDVIYDRLCDNPLTSGQSEEHGQSKPSSPSSSQGPTPPSTPHEPAISQQHFEPSTTSTQPSPQEILFPSNRTRLEQLLPLEDEMEKTVRVAIEGVQDGSFDEFSARKFTNDVKLLLSANRRPVDNNPDVERFSHLICARLNKLFVLERCQKVLHGLRFFYTAVVLTGEVVMWIPSNQEEGQLLILVDHQALENFFWKKVFARTQFTAFRYQEVFNLLVELGEMVKTTYMENPGVCCHLARILLTAYSRLRMVERVFLESTKHLVLIMAKCAWNKGRYDIAEKNARTAAETFFNLENADACELWSKCCHKRGDLRLAIQAAELAIGCCRPADRPRLQQQLYSLHYELTEIHVDVRDTEVNPEWLQGSNNLHNALQLQTEKAKKKREDHKKKNSKYKTKAVPKTREVPDALEGDTTTSRRRPNNTSSRINQVKDFENFEAIRNAANQLAPRPVPVRRRNEEVLIEVDLWDEESQGSRAASDVSESEESAEEYDSEVDDQPDEDNQGDSGDDVPTKTWFEKSQDLYRDGNEEDKLIVGGGVDIVFTPKSQQIGPIPRYQPFEQLHVLEMLLKTQPEKYKRCRIELDGPHKAVCTVLESGQSHHKIEIHGRRKCGQTFNNDEVVVEIIDEDRTMGEDSGKVFGRVVGVLNSKFGEIEFPLLACTNNPKEVDVMHPMCKSVPKLYIWNGKTKENFKHHKYQIDLYKIDENGKLQFDRYFNILPNKRGQYVFLVVFLTWLPQYTYPKGAVLKVLDCGTSFSTGLHVLINQFKVPTHYTKATVAHVEELLKKHEKQSRKEYMNLTNHTVFTIDPPQSKDLDDALSVYPEDDNFIVGVHIADVASVVKKGDAVDTEAAKRATSFYPSAHLRTHNMLPEPLSQNKLSLLPQEERHVLSVFFLIDKNGETIKEPLVKKCIIKSCRQFSYREAQLIIDGKFEDVECPQILKENIQLLHQLTQLIRTKRLKNSRFAVSYEDPRFLDAEAIPDDEDAHALVEELMIKANHYIASWLIQVDRRCVPLRCQAAPSQEELDQWIQEEGHVMDMLIQLQDKTISDRKIEVGKHCSAGTNRRTAYIPVHKNVWKQILNAAQQGDVGELRKLLCCDSLHPLQCLATHHWLNILRSAVYKCSADGNDCDFAHFMLDIEPYTHFTSPIRRYIDLVVHRLVHAVLDGEQSPYTTEEVQDICLYVTDAIKRQRRFDRGCRGIRQAERLAKSPMVFDAVVETVSDSKAALCIPSLQNLSSRSREIAFNLLDFCRKPAERQNALSNKTEVIGSWNKRIYRYEDLYVRQERDNRQSNQSQRDPLEVSIKSNIHTVHVQLSDFSKLLKAMLENPNDVKEIAKRLSPRGEDCNLTDHTGVQRVSSEGCGDSQINHHCKFNLKFFPGQVLRVQITASADQGILSPNVQLFQVCENINVCLNHIHDPVNTYARYVTTSIREQKFQTVADYQRAWLPIVEMETAVSSVSSEETAIISDVKIQLHHKGSVILGSFTVDTLFCEARKLEIDGKTIDRLKEMKTDETPYDKCQTRRSMDYLCIRYAPTAYQKGSGIFEHSSVWIGHAVIKKVKKRKASTSDDSDKIVVTFQLTSKCRPPSYEFTAVVEVIFKTEVDRRTELMLTLLEDGKNLASYIALHSKIPSLGPLRLQICQRCPTDIQPGELTGSGFMPENNASQTIAIKKTLKSRFSLIQGPPGTGKTYTGLKLVYLFNKINKQMHSNGYDVEQKQILFCGPSNKSVDLVAKYLMQKLGAQCPKIVRVYGKTIENKDFPVPKRDMISNRSMRGLQSDKDLRSVTLHYMIRQEGKPKAKDICAFDALFLKYFQNRDKVKITLKTIKTYTRLVAKAQQEELKICDVILCTCAVAGNPKLTKVSRISQCIIDESAMCPEPQSMIPIIATKTDQVVLIGDHKQLRPIVKCTHAAELGLDQSLFERYKEGRAFLNTQYRMHPKICEFPSRTFYEGKLQTGPERHEDARWYIPKSKELSIWPVKDNPKVFCHVEGVEATLTVSTEEGNEQSKSNLLEVEKIVESFLYLVKTCKVPIKNINLMTQYNAQRSAVKQRLDELGFFTSITTQTVVASQGGEWDYVIFSTVRSLPHYKIEREATPGWLKHNLGFITDRNQINVALTRARKGLIIIGNANLLRCDPVWKKLLNLYQDEGCYVNAYQFPPIPPKRRRGNHGVPLVAGNPGVLKNRI